MLLIVVLAGGYDVAATDRRNPIAKNPIASWALNTTMTNSVQRLADDLPRPAELTIAMVASLQP